MRRKKIIKITLFAILVGLVIVPLVSIQANKYIYKNRVTTYLIEEKGFEKEDIGSVEGKWEFKLPAYYAVVTFKNEQYVEYTYFAHDKDVFQFNYNITEEGQKEGIKVEDLKNNNPRY
ncbi:DUF3139 domain-containing protein [Psychrobacillus psychrodurans]|uniref:DUF3139 domain-containing protein n=1 Tax=Psychrobacillus psychrodurans TaxID=126157 RepID=UPI0008F2A76E|nr:DUF3139 domain-containing protein [Psychrobacillus psychrodurans]MCZ8542306.1 DUF3139 domain-containing protein [Psychrobacillus psychrodurans]SFN25677.1 Protein of unknown function [Psychrobacillus psychrodurans]